MRNYFRSTTSSYQAGFTLIEVLIAVVIFTIGILSVNAMQIAAIKGNSSANRVTESTSWASDRIETLIGLKYTDPNLDDVDGNGDLGLDETGANADGTLTSPDGNYTISWNVAEDYPFPDIKTVNMIIQKQDGPTVRTFTMTYMKSNSI